LARLLLLLAAALLLVVADTDIRVVFFEENCGLSFLSLEPGSLLFGLVKTYKPLGVCCCAGRFFW